MLINNVIKFGGGPTTTLSGTGDSASVMFIRDHGALRNRFHHADWSPLSGTPDGYAFPGAWIPPSTAGAMRTIPVASTATLAASGAGGLNGEVSITAGATLSATLQLIVSAVLNTTCTATLAGELLAVLQAQLAATASGTMTGTMTGIGHMATGMAATVTFAPTATAVGHMELDVTSSAELSPDSLAAAVWRATASLFDDPGSMGEKLNAAGTAGDPWTTALPGSYAAGTAGSMLHFLWAFAHNKTITDPVAGTMTVYDSDGTTVLFVADLFEDASGTTQYQGSGAERREEFS